MIATMPSPLDKVLEAARVALEARRQEALERAEKIRTAVDAYVEAVELEMAADVAGKLGVDGPSATSAGAAAKALRDLVADLPELRKAPSEVSQRSVLESASATMRDLIATSASTAPRRPAMQAYEAGLEARALWDELNALDADVPAPLFKAMAAELAARARLLQQRGDNAELIPERVIKRLTAIAGERGIRGIYGLARHHEGDWEDLARKARAERERFQAGGRALLTAKLPITAQKIAENARATRNDDDVEADDDDGEDEQAESYPGLQQAAARRPVVLVGGIPKQPKLRTLKRRLGFDLEWAETDAAGSQSVQSLEGRILDGNIAAVVILEGLGGHKHFEPLVAAARQTGTPLAYGNTAGTGALKKAFSEIEQKLGGG